MSKTHEPHPATTAFEQDLHTLVLESFAAGAAIEGVWEVTPTSPIVPNWRVVIEKTAAADGAADRDFVDD